MILKHLKNSHSYLIILFIIFCLLFFSTSFFTVEFQNIENKLFQTRIFFPSNSIPGKYTVTIYHVKNNIIINNKEKSIILKKSGVGSQIYKFAHNNSVAYGLFTIIFAVLSGFLAATLFRRN